MSATNHHKKLTAVKLFNCALLASLTVACTQPGPTESTVAEPAPAAAVVENSVAVASQQANALFETLFMAEVMRSPTYLTYIGNKKDQDKWDDISDANAVKEVEIAKQDLAKLEALDEQNLDQQTTLSLQLYKQRLVERIADHQWRFHTYPVSQMDGVHSQVPSLLINQHRIDDVKDAQDYISRLVGVKPLMAQLTENIRIRAEKGIVIPKFIFPLVLSSSRNLLKGAPFDDGPDSTLLADFSNKLNGLQLPQQQYDALLQEAASALKNHVKPGYEQLIAYLEQLSEQASNDAGAWKFPEGKSFYEVALKRTTTTELSAAEIHDIGLKEVARIHQQMREIMKKVEFSGDLKAFFKFMKNDPQFYYPEGEAGRAAYLKEANALIDEMKGHLDQLFNIKPKADLVVKAVEPFREKSAGKAFYERPSLDGSRPGQYYVNLYRMSNMPKYQMAALAYHEGLPGHHMQFAIANELQGVPKFRKLGSYTAYVEGWGLYSELLPKEVGFYVDPYADFGRLAMELWRACRLVVDTGIHDKRWTRQQAIDYLIENTPNPEGDVIKAIERYIVLPSQATAYKIGMLKMIELREKAQNALKDQFDLRRFHDVILQNGPIPLNVLEQMVDKYIEQDLAGDN